MSESVSFSLRTLTLYNWGTFNGLHLANFDPAGTAVIGPTGSGKTTLIDALMTLLVAQPKYNLASTGGHESDRDLVSYIRGVAGAGSGSGENEHISRKGKTRTALCARFEKGEQHISIASILWMDGSGFSAADRKDLWLVSERDDQDLDHWLAVHRDQGARALKQLAKETEKFQVFETKSSYLAYLRKFFEVSDKAFTLLNRAAGLKQLNSIDEIFRELVLEDQSKFGRAQEVAKEFDDLAGIREELNIARRQETSLLPLLKLDIRHADNLQTLQKHRQIQTDLPAWFAKQGHALWQEETQKIQRASQLAQARADNLVQLVATAELKRDHLRNIYKDKGGDKIELLETKHQHALQELKALDATIKDYRRITERYQLEPSLDLKSFEANQRHLSKIAETQQHALDKLDETRLSLSAELKNLKDEEQELTADLAQIESRPGSNVPAQHQSFREGLAAHLALNPDQLPFVAELIEVKLDQQAWRGAIERAIGGHRLRLIVPEAQMRDALHWVNHRDNRLHVRLLKARDHGKTPHFFDDGYCKKLNFKAHDLREHLKRFVAGIDRHCVADTEALQNTSHGLTQEGMMSGGHGLFEKQDQRRLGQDWMTGFDNRDQLLQLNTSLEKCREFQLPLLKEVKVENQKIEAIRQDLILLVRAQEVRFEQIDKSPLQARLAELASQIEMLNARSSEMGIAKQDYELAETEFTSCQRKLSQEQQDLAVYLSDLKKAEVQLAASKKRCDSGLDATAFAEVAALINTLNKDAGKLTLDSIADVERKTQHALSLSLSSLEDNKTKIENELVRQMSLAQKVDNGYLVESGTQVFELPDYLKRLTILQEEALPEKLERFLNYLNQSSDQGVNQMLADIDNEVTIIEERIDDLNQTLFKVDFQPDRYLQITPQKIGHSNLRKLEDALKRLRSAHLIEDLGESEYRALQNLVDILRDAAERKATLGAKALLDPRHRLKFSIDVLSRSSGKLIERRQGSQGGSGGEKEIIASYILTASLSYALCPDGSDRPLFSTIVLDEAFSKSSLVVAGRIVAALREFGLHPIFVTPNKEIRLLKNHTRAAVLVHRRSNESSLASMSWEKLEAHSDQRKRHSVQE